jgi:uncharacterized protein YukE
MPLLPDPAELDAIADRIGGHAVAARARATSLATAVAAAGWRGLAADAFCTEAFTIVAALRRAAGRLDSAADTLRRHAGNLRALLDDLALIGTDGMRALEGILTDPDGLVSDGKRIFDAGKGLITDAFGVVGI